jgi:hypothetical protein
MIARYLAYGVGLLALGALMVRLLPAWVTALFLAYIALQFTSAYLASRHRKQETARISRLQEEARHTTGASLIGSAIHVAGHPLLERDQSIVLALSNAHLGIFRYENSKSLDVIHVQDIESVKTVVYDDDRTPHDNVIDPAAQALLINFVRDGLICSSLFRRMLKTRPIDWYHALEKARHIEAIARKGAA